MSHDGVVLNIMESQLACDLLLHVQQWFDGYQLHNLNSNDKALVLNMRNHPQIKKWMSNQDDIPETSHFNFIKNLENIVDQRYFLVKQHKSIVGSINFSKVDLSSSVEFGIYTNPFAQLKGAGSMLEAVASYYAFIELGVNKIKLEVFSNNERVTGFFTNWRDLFYKHFHELTPSVNT